LGEVQARGGKTGKWEGWARKKGRPVPLQYRLSKGEGPELSGKTKMRRGYIGKKAPREIPEGNKKEMKGGGDKKPGPSPGSQIRETQTGWGKLLKWWGPRGEIRLKKI